MTNNVPFKAIGLAVLLVLAVTADAGSQAQPYRQADVDQNPAAPADGPAPKSPEGASPAADRLREGTQLTDVRGHFEPAAEGPVFVEEAGRRLVGLENLNLQRISRTLNTAEDPASLKWEVSGMITEYEGRNYILVERAVYSRARR